MENLVSILHNIFMITLYSVGTITLGFTFITVGHVLHEGAKGAVKEINKKDKKP